MGLCQGLAVSQYQRADVICLWTRPSELYGEPEDFALIVAQLDRLCRIRGEWTYECRASARESLVL